MESYSLATGGGEIEGQGKVGCEDYTDTIDDVTTSIR